MAVGVAAAGRALAHHGRRCRSAGGVSVGAIQRYCVPGAIPLVQLTSRGAAVRSLATSCGQRQASTTLASAASAWRRGFAAQASKAVVDEGASAPPGPPSGVVMGPGPRIIAVVDELCALNVIEIAQVIDLFKQRAGITDAMMPVMGGRGGAGGVAGAVAEEVAPAVVKESFDVKLTGFDAKNKIKVIKEVRAITGLGLKEAKELVEAAPKVLKKEVKKEEAEAIAEKLKEVGAEVALE